MIKFFLITFFVFSSILPTQNNLLGQVITDVSIGKRYSMRSEILNENRSYSIYLPNSYNNKAFSPKKYPVLVLLDGDAHFHSASGVVQFLGNTKKIPEMIIVGISNTDRTRDLTPTHCLKAYDGKEIDFYKSSGGGDNFLRFIHEELLPKVDSSYRTIPYKILVGHSFGGLLAVHSFLSKKKTFDSYIAIDPSVWFDSRFEVRKAIDNSKEQRKYESSLYISVAHNSSSAIDTTEPRKAVDKLYSVLKEDAPDFHFKMQYFEDEDHSSVPLISLYKGLLFLFEGFHLSNSNERTISEIKEHYEKISSKMGIQFLPSEDLINDLGYYYLYLMKDPDKAIQFFAYNTELYPNSGNVYDSQAEAYKVKGNTKKAIEYYKKSLEIYPENKHSKKMVRELEEQNK